MRRSRPTSAVGAHVVSLHTLGDERPVGGLIATHWVLGVCGHCGHEQPHGENHRAICPGCGVELHAFALYRDLHAR